MLALIRSYLPLVVVVLIGALNVVMWAAWWPIFTGYIREGDPLRVILP